MGAFGASKATTLSYHGYRLVVPPTWPVYRLSSDPTACVRFDRHAVYLGVPGADQRCPAHAAGHTEAILLEPLASTARGTGTGAQALPIPGKAGTVAGFGSAARLVDRVHGVIVNATWGKHPGVIQQALHVRSLRAVAAESRAASAWASAASARSSAASARAAAAGRATATGRATAAAAAPER